MTKAEYVDWLATRPTDAAKWNYNDCVRADHLIRETAKANFNKWARTNIKNADARQFITDCVRWHFGSAEVDGLLTKLKCYPDWM